MAVQFVILGLLLTESLTGYELRQRFSAGISLFYAASLGGIQRALGILDSRGWVTVEESTGSGRPKRVYSITESGRDAWRGWMLGPIADSDAEQSTLAKVYLLGGMPDQDRKRTISALRGRALRDLERLTVLRTRVETTSVPDELHDVAQFRRATLDYGIRAHELMAQWLGELEQS